MSQEPEYPPLRDMGGRDTGAPGTGEAPGSGPGEASGLEALRRENAALREHTAELERRTTELRNRLHAHPGISLAQGVLMERYRLPDPATAFALLREASQRRNIRLHTLADAVVRTPAPAADAATWFPGRARYSPPPLPGVPVAPGDRDSHGAVLSGVLRRVLNITQAGMGNVQLVEGGVLRMEKHIGLNRRFTDYFAFVEGPTTSCHEAAEQRRQVTVPDVATADVFDEESRTTILQAGSRACHSVPMVNRAGAVLGVISSHHTRPLAGFTAAQLRALEETGAAAGRWLSWHRRTVVLDALEHLHTAARTAH
ncbi:ANTAR domain-containing protein [Streptomyces sp. NBC_00670]|jgi:hypothetical protein|uniref:ANTAR domain-containing protein n=1 Tax=Streptomyces sp. NBC_00670 TaxID=2975804 RepID=UPI002E37156E|nr:ANTAR domain-containing protein [Streptomyces sp. NBC_00670]